MNNKEFLITYFHETMNDEFIIKLKFKSGELTLEEREALKTLGKEKVPLTGSFGRYQDPNQTQL